MRFIIFKFGAFPDQVAKLVRIAHRWILAVPANDKKKAVVKAMDEDEALEVYKLTNNVSGGLGTVFTLVHFTDAPGFEDKVVDVIYTILGDVYQVKIEQTEA